MDDTIHYNLCEEFKKICIKTELSKFIELIDSKKWHNIFTYNNKSYDVRLLNYIHMYMCYEFIPYIITTRKCSNLNDLNYGIIAKLKETDDIAIFFSFYNNNEITQIINNNVRDKIIYHKKYGCIKYTSLIFFILQHNKILYQFMIKYAKDNDISLFIKSTLGGYALNYKFMLTFDYAHILADLEEHEEVLIFKKSLRYLWLSSCIKT
jgi:hypothetical protein